VTKVVHLSSTFTRRIIVAHHLLLQHLIKVTTDQKACNWKVNKKGNGKLRKNGHNRQAKR